MLTVIRIVGCFVFAKAVTEHVLGTVKFPISVKEVGDE